ncbi:Ubiquitin-conjugating enzyme E2 15 [Lecanora helva]
MAGSAASGLLGRQLKQMQNDKDLPGISCGLVGNNIFKWEVTLMISDDCKFYGVYPSGEVCISILHAPTNDPFGYESAAERWSPVQTPETILISVISMLSSPNDESPANVEAARMWREDPKEFRKRCRANVRASLGEE